MEIDRFERLMKDYNILYNFIADLAVRHDTAMYQTAYQEVDDIFKEANKIIKNVRTIKN